MTYLMGLFDLVIRFPLGTFVLIASAWAIIGMIRTGRLDERYGLLSVFPPSVRRWMHGE